MLLAVVIPLSVRAGRPLTVDDAEPVAPGQFELEAGVLYEDNSGVHHYETPFSLAYGLVPTLEVGLGFGGQIEQREELQDAWSTEAGLGDLTLGAKWNPLSEEKYWASQALSFAVKLPTAEHHRDFGSGRTDYDLTYIASITISGRFSAHLNAGYTWTGDYDSETLDDILHGGGAVGFQATGKLELVAELYADVPVDDASASSLVLDGGLRWNAFDDLVLDAAMGAGLHGDAPHWQAAIGFNWTFGLKTKK
jgi:hypothetical protein